MAGLRRLIVSLVMVLVTLVVAHNLVFLLAYGTGYDEALANTGHGAAWGQAVTVVLVAAICLVALAGWQLYRLGIVARSLDPGEGPLTPPPGVFGRRLSGLSWRIAVASTVLFVAQENIEHMQAGEALPGWTVLGSAEYPNAALVFVLVALVVAFIGSAFEWHRERLVARIASALRPARLRPAGLARRPDLVRDRRPDALVGQGSGVRAPPAPRSIAGGPTQLTLVA